MIFLDNGVISMDVLTQLNINFREEKEQEVRINEMRKRASRCVCRYCGNPLTLRKLTYAAYDEAKIEIYCEHCDRIEYGTEPEIYKIAKYYVNKMGFDHYLYMDESVRKNQMNISMICSILEWGYKSIEILEKDGFNIEIHFDENKISDVVSFTNTILENLQGE